MSHEDESRAGDAGRAGWLIAHPLSVLVALDAVAIAFAAAAAAQLGDPDVLLHCVWIVLALQAFTFGLRTSAVRIAAASIFVVAYAVVADDPNSALGLTLTDLDLEEWPLMAVIAVIVAIMADRVTLTGRRYAALYRAASDRLITAQEDERNRLAVDLHDGVGQTITALTLTLDAADAQLAAAAASSDTDRGAAGREAVRRAREIADVALEEVRGVAFRLRPARLTETGLVAALGELAATAGLAVEFSPDPSLVRPGILDPGAEVDAYRIVQEALGNAGRHSGATHVGITVRRVGRVVRIEVADDGIGFDLRARARPGPRAGEHARPRLRRGRDAERPVAARGGHPASASTSRWRRRSSPTLASDDAAAARASDAAVADVARDAAAAALAPGAADAAAGGAQAPTGAHAR